MLKSFLKAQVLLKSNGFYACIFHRHYRKSHHYDDTGIYKIYEQLFLLCINMLVILRTTVLLKVWTVRVQNNTFTGAPLTKSKSPFQKGFKE